MKVNRRDRKPQHNPTASVGQHGRALIAQRAWTATDGTRYQTGDAVATEHEAEARRLGASFVRFARTETHDRLANATATKVPDVEDGRLGSITTGLCALGFADALVPLGEREREDDEETQD